MELTKIDVEIEGIADLMFDRFVDHSKEVRPPDQKFYMEKGNKVVVPAENFNSFLVGDKVPGCAKLFEGRKSGIYMRTLTTHVAFSDSSFAVKKNSKPLVFKNFDDKDFYIFQAAGVTKSGGVIIKQEIQDRPVVKCPWTIDLSFTLLKNELIDENKLHNYFERGGILISIGTYRPRFGRFLVKKWVVT
jgi:hypothetical protein